MNRIPKEIKLPETGRIVLIFSQHLPEGEAAVEHQPGYWDGQKFRRLADKESEEPIIRYPLGWEEIQPSPEAIICIETIREEYYKNKGKKN